MNILSKFKKIIEKPKPKVAEEIKESAKEKPAVKEPASIKELKIFSVLVSPHITEKATDFSSLRKYVFKVSKVSNKIEIKKALEKLYNVKVEKVHTISIPKKEIILGRTRGKKPGFKKAIVTLKEGYSIDIVPH